MLRLFDTTGITRRELLTIGGLGLWGVGLNTLLAARAAGKGGVSPLTGKSVILIFQQGGPSQFETWDPKPELPSGMRTLGGTVATSLPSVRFGATFPALAHAANQLTIVRSFQTNNGGHNLRPIVGPETLETSLGVHYARVAGATRPQTGMPTNAVLYPSAVSEEVPGPQARGDLSATGGYSSGYAPFVPGAKGQLQQDMQVQLPRKRLFEDRRTLLRRLDTLSHQWEAGGELSAADELRQQAYQLLLGGGVARALDLSLEDPRTLAAYDTAPLADRERWNIAARGRRGYYWAQAESLGKLLLMARRLCEAGCGFVTVHAGYAGVWDMHADGNNLNMQDGMEAVGRPFDHAVAALVGDLERRGLSDQILVAACGEMGRTPRINRRGGRDHWGKLAPLLLAGGGLPGGRVVGQSTRDGGEPATAPLGPENLISTILRTVVDVGQLRLLPDAPQPLVQLTSAAPLVPLG